MTKNYTVVFTCLVNPTPGVNEEVQQTAEYSYSINATSQLEARSLAKEQHAVAVNTRILMGRSWEN
jgi:hypothetical protein